MSRLVVEEAGPATSVQDFGRTGVLRFGLSSAGAMDRFALAAANALAGAPANAAGIEIGPLPARFSAADGPVRVALYGAARDVTLAGEAMALGRSFMVPAGESVALRAARGGTFTYLAVEGGIPGTPVFGSLSVHARAGLGSPFARPLAAGDALDVARASARAEYRLPAPAADDGPIRVVLGPQDDYFDADAIALFLGSEWRVSPVSDRMGFRLQGPRIAAARGHNIVSDGIANGHIQIPGSGEPLVLLADRGTTGGYPKIAAIVTADLGRFAQIAPGRAFRFAALDVAAAQEAARAWRAALDGLVSRVEPVAARTPTSEALLRANLAGGAVSALDTDTWSQA
jgi:biotin-dependent carboxylase-like uncharacterized protein